MENIDLQIIETFLTTLGTRYQQSTNLFLLGGSALLLLGSPRPTLDIDYVGDDLSQSPLQTTISQIAHEMQIEVEPVPIDRFIPIPDGAEIRKRFVGQYGNISVYIFDPYTIALTKIDRGFDTDIEDVIFLIRQDIITYEQLQQMALTAIEEGQEFDIIPADVQAHLQALFNRLT